MTDRRPVNCRCTVTPILAPAAIVDPPILPPLGVLDPLPKLPPVSIPRKVYAEPIVYDGARYLDGAIPDLVREVEAKLLAEDARLRRLLPPAPAGFEWHGEIAHDVDLFAGDFTATDTIRLRYRLVEVG